MRKCGRWNRQTRSLTRGLVAQFLWLRRRRADATRHGAPASSASAKIITEKEKQLDSCPATKTVTRGPSLEVHARRAISGDLISPAERAVAQAPWERGRRVPVKSCFLRSRFRGANPSAHLRHRPCGVRPAFWCRLCEAKSSDLPHRRAPKPFDPRPSCTARKRRANGGEMLLRGWAVPPVSHFNSPAASEARRRRLIAAEDQASKSSGAGQPGRTPLQKPPLPLVCGHSSRWDGLSTESQIDQNAGALAFTASGH